MAVSKGNLTAISSISNNYVEVIRIAAVVEAELTTTTNMEELMKKKKEIEDEISEYGEILEQQGGVGMTEALVDKEGYPRADIDLYSVRSSRQKIICLQNDHKAVMKEIEEELHRIHAKAREEKGARYKKRTPALRFQLQFSSLFKIDRVDHGSPAFTASLRVGDQVLRFGSISRTNFKTLQDVAKVVQHSIDKSISVTVLRDGKEQRLTLVPQKWSGQGFLGCNIVPL
ncbi:LOW QUALITY PROTEIN: 26S proteasome non-ATPase regulatory subunit 9-like [Octopus sinensis]|uniref:26S proteasome non-ATPase regulatory subunit 9 n=1 Tax=Octopus sinensis TaxID=2607531 RepID=A0A6P7TIH0_9MOLL|nr:LOW QUALITY PROTEIN: 26S proteasome non-ATPase regulatory subunit 9-like [Octopus sinensis]